MRCRPIGSALLAASLAAPVLVAAADAPVVYKTQCAKCHGDTGRADTPFAKPLKIRPLVGDAELAATAPAEIAKMIRNNPKHAPFIKRLTPEDIDTVAPFVKSLAATKP